MEEFLDKQEILSQEKYSLQHFDFQEPYTFGAEDDQTSYVEKKTFKFRYRRALDTPEVYSRRNKRMTEKQQARFLENNAQLLIENYIQNPNVYENEYLAFVEN